MTRVLGLLAMIAAFASGAAPYARAVTCSDGVDCYCDRVKNPSNVAYDRSLIYCEDFEDPAYYNDVPGAWYRSPSSNPGFRGGASRWLEIYHNTSEGNWRQGQPSNPTRGSTCSYNVCGPSEWRKDDLWQGNSVAALDVQAVGEHDDEIAGLTLNQGHDGNRWMAWRIAPNKTAGIMGEIRFASTTEIGFTALVAYSSNLATAVGSGDWGGDFIRQPWKHEEWGQNLSTLFMGNVGAGGAPFSPAIFHKSQTACEALVANANVTVGRIACNDAALQIGADFRRSTQWPLGTWACVRGHIKGMNSTNGSMDIWFNDRKIFSMTNANFAATLRDNSFSNFSPNHYFNGNTGLWYATASVETFYRYSDNVHVRSGPPAACTDIANPGGSPPPDSDPLPLPAPVLLP